MSLYQLGAIRTILILPTEAKSPPTGKRWLILDGMISHINLTASYLTKLIPGTTPNYGRTLIAAATASGNYPLFNMAATVDQSQKTDWLINDEYAFYFSGGAGALCRLLVLEF